MDKFRVEITNLAAEMMETHADYLADFNDGSPQKFKEAFYAAVDGLVTLPRRYSRVYADDETMGELRKAWFYHNRYAAIFRIDDNKVVVEYVIDDKQENAWLFDL